MQDDVAAVSSLILCASVSNMQLWEWQRNTAYRGSSFFRTKITTKRYKHDADALTVC